jgi:hypothetical protein
MLVPILIVNFLIITTNSIQLNNNNNNNNYYRLRNLFLRSLFVKDDEKKKYVMPKIQEQAYNLKKIILSKIYNLNADYYNLTEDEKVLIDAIISMI